ncbi:GNAT family N-acetyltransferase [Cellulomonas xylanilytica]|uniref:N-acetyltransferase GCN5 n=1 Tax=Cellulomonas xylanilytica TaxID=233583 RepID=A0A510V6D3_9CELL|nr:GNAT family N-acetyltransferase [Cellulomonas xylanilytica]GEK22434.1 N-acetyltransferase GCN5 [Cellulomonas xylanilytica]
MAEVRVAPCARADDAVAVLDRPGDAGRCFCQWDRLTRPAYRESPADVLKDRLATRITGADASPGVVATVEGEPVGWASVAPRPEFPRIRNSPSMTTPELKADWDDPGIWSVTCFVVRTGYRRRGVASALLPAAVEHARASGAHTLEGYPLEPGPRRLSSADLFRGTVSLFRAAGFDVVARPRDGRAVVRLVL